MSQFETTSTETNSSLDEQAWQGPDRASDWEAETDVMPPEYCQQLLRISRQLQKNGR
jgi:hypothetical protein